MLDLERLLRVPHVDPYLGFDLSPDGSRAVFAWNLSGSWEIYELSLSEGAGPRPLTAGPGSKFAPRFSPDGRRLAFAVDFDGSENNHILVCDLASGQQTDLFPGVTFAIQPLFAWSPDGKEIAFLSDRSGCFSLYAIEVDTGRQRTVLEMRHPAVNVHWSPDGRYLAVGAETSGQDYGIFVVPSAGGQARQIAGDSGPLNAHDPAWSPDGQTLAFRCDARGRFQLALYAVATGAVRWLSDDEWERQSPAWSPDGARLACVANRGADTRLELITPGGATVPIQFEPGIHYRPKFSPDGQRILFVFDNPRHPDDLFSYSLRDGSFRQLTRSLPADLADYPFVMPQEIHYPSMDGREVPALLYRAAQTPAPAVINIHGGPNWLYQFTWNPLMTCLADRGLTVLAPNYRGSTGYGRDWQLANRFDLGGGDTDDVAAGAQYLVRAGLAEAGRIAVTGRSHGGYLTMTCLTRYPELWAAGSAVVPFLNWFSSHENSREDLQHWDIENFGDPVANHDLWYERSPFFFLERILAPVQLISGANDPRCPASESIEARDILARLGKQVDLLVFPDEGHAFLKIENVLAAEIRRVTFLEQHLRSDRTKP